MVKEWQELTRLTGDEPIIVESVRITGKDIAIEGEFELPPLARLAPEDQVFVAAFVRSHGSIKQMEELFGVSYPTIKNRLNRISEQLSFVEIKPIASNAEVLEQLEHGDISVKEALERMKE
ncbi:MAG: DUF2089 domain-containing protein [candidate division Zixibacteria bacterium]|nr:DUF2089 domain-containing protein [candidate division Zixibacteria bacterium]MBU1470644.1 DUF2089 domain-containing protein [candidate division Zixibacteria bacterium]MBU2624135.1 DUF2089 domain-containing protein [candidate division Zixibacteria bacterium]